MVYTPHSFNFFPTYNYSIGRVEATRSNQNNSLIWKTIIGSIFILAGLSFFKFLPPGSTFPLLALGFIMWGMSAIILYWNTIYYTHSIIKDLKLVQEALSGTEMNEYVLNELAENYWTTAISIYISKLPKVTKVQLRNELLQILKGSIFVYLSTEVNENNFPLKNKVLHPMKEAVTSINKLIKLSNAQSLLEGQIDFNESVQALKNIKSRLNSENKVNSELFMNNRLENAQNLQELG